MGVEDSRLSFGSDKTKVSIDMMKNIDLEGPKHDFDEYNEKKFENNETAKESNRQKPQTNSSSSQPSPFHVRIQSNGSSKSQTGQSKTLGRADYLIIWQ